MKNFIVVPTYISCILQWNGKESNKDERAAAAAFVMALKASFAQWNISIFESFESILQTDRGGRPVVETVGKQFECCCYCHHHDCLCPADEEGLSEAHEFYKNIPTGIFGSKKPKSAEAVCI